MNNEEDYNKETHVQIRVLSAHRLPRDPNTYLRSPEVAIEDYNVNKKEIIDTVIIHIHGGGFIAMNSFSHQIYTRVWANDIANSVIFMIDYRLAPASRYPSQIEDVWEAYTWIIDHCYQTMGIHPKKVIVTGDSAGGNLSIALTLMAIQRGYRVPDALVPCYPSTISSKEYFWPSMLSSLDDPILSS